MMKRILILAGCLAIAGCMPHFKEHDSYNSMFRTEAPSGKGDPYTFGGIGEGSGGQMARQSYATDNPGADFRNATDSGKMGVIDRDRTPAPDQNQQLIQSSGL